MIITRTPIAGPAVLELEHRSDDRGFFARTFCRAEFLAAGLEPLVEQCNLSYNHRAGTLRGMHFQVAPHPESKLMRCTRGGIL
ncbi:MAG TPA: dTDP-4-dehydrorhamnose 3,5-epimerase family protein, partial [Dermatophilaceae bacterium]|nr:dTDP-4-dehydrorhamnose 3,5-epimerase family protein [Dermatophilaceae bacterium]